MEFSNTSLQNGLIQECERRLFNSDYGRISNNTKLLNEFTNLINQGQDYATIRIIKSNGTWRFDDSNHGDIPVATTDLVSGQRNYEMQSGHLKVFKVEAKDASGNWEVLKQLDEVRQKYSFEEMYKENSTPRYYDLEGDTIKLYPATNYNETDGLKVHFQRASDPFVKTDTTKRPGIASIFHPIIVVHACYQYAVSHRLDMKNDLLQERTLLENELKTFYSRRNGVTNPRILTRIRTSR